MNYWFKHYWPVSQDPCFSLLKAEQRPWNNLHHTDRFLRKFVRVISLKYMQYFSFQFLIMIQFLSKVEFWCICSQVYTTQKVECYAHFRFLLSVPTSYTQCFCPIWAIPPHFSLWPLLMFLCAINPGILLWFCITYSHTSIKDCQWSSL